MSRLRDRLSEQYAKHYARVNPTTDPVAMAERNYKSMQAMYSDLLSALPEGSRVLDLGCGTGMILYWLSKQRDIIPIGVDNSATQVQIAKQCVPGMDIFFEEGLSFLQRHPDSFSGILCIDVLEHLETADLCLELVETARAALTPGGFLFCRVPNAANLFSSYSRYMDLTHERLFTSTSLLQLFEAAGFQRCQVRPERYGELRNRFRVTLETPFHRFLFRLCGHGPREKIFTANVCIAAFK